jgi:hypothetical protein
VELLSKTQNQLNPGSPVILAGEGTPKILDIGSVDKSSKGQSSHPPRVEQPRNP